MKQPSPLFQYSSSTAGCSLFGKGGRDLWHLDSQIKEQVLMAAFVNSPLPFSSQAWSQAGLDYGVVIYFCWSSRLQEIEAVSLGVL